MIMRMLEPLLVPALHLLVAKPIQKEKELAQEADSARMTKTEQRRPA